MRILVTGAAGFIGFHLCKKLVENGHRVVGLDNVNDYYDPELKYARLQELGMQKSETSVFGNTVVSSTYGDILQFVRMQLEDREALPALFEKEKFEAVVNLAAQAGVRYSLENPMAYVDSNLVGFVNILECCRHYNIQHLLYASSSSVYGENEKMPFAVTDNVDHPISLYAATKKSNELMAYTYSHLYGIPTTGLRFFTVYGPWGRPDMAIFLFTKAISEGKPIKVFNNGDMSRDFTYIDDIVQGVEIVLDNPPLKENDKPAYRLSNIGNGSSQSLGDFIKAIENSMGVGAKKEYLPMQPGDVPKTWANISDLEVLGYKSTTSIDEGVKKFIEWFKGYRS
ncbi:NAD-dependent epimerase [Sinomicrobium soli]|uniref:NAD-dependent epimerase n=1 Tax=Sinomicrobium sp. N-1-3-6 TaxID=2219864 RepID=UPI000DCE2F7A|nr:NAD-dependent epimerase [Sinomicrobium sp. N-1-3-6]RAV30998.1 NAD-dependent epimerase [Sinomicrobium sp. N-1-3-6]